MTLGKFDIICRKLPGAEMVVQWGESHVWKIGGKVFAIGGQTAFTFKTTALSFEMLLEQGLAVRAPYLPRGGWVQVTAGVLKDTDAAAYIKASHELVALSLTKAARERLA